SSASNNWRNASRCSSACARHCSFPLPSGLSVPGSQHLYFLRRILMQRSHSTRRAHCIRLFCLGIFSAAVLGSAPTISHAQSAADYPSRALTLVSPFPPGGGNDGVGRLLAHEVSQILGQSIVVENRPGAGGNVGTSTVARSSPDGYTLVLAQNSI